MEAKAPTLTREWDTSHPSRISGVGGRRWEGLQSHPTGPLSIATPGARFVLSRLRHFLPSEERFEGHRKVKLKDDT